jgi:hypothetical protein
VLKKIIIFICFLIYFIIGIFIHDDYGINWDEQASRNYGFISGDYILGKLLPDKIYYKIYSNITKNKFSEKIKEKNPPKLTDQSFMERAYGVTFELPAAILETVLNLNDIDKIYKFRHLLVFFVFFLSSIIFYKLCFLISKDKVISLLFASMLVIHPRIFSDTFHNSKDLIFLSYLIISIFFGYKLIKKNSFKNIILFSIFTALSFGLKIIGILLLYSISTIYLIQNQSTLQTRLKFLFFISLITLTFCYIFWPYLWENPITNFKLAFELFSNFKWSSEIPFMGKFINSDTLPWYYIPLFFLITTPPYILILIIFGLFIFIYQLFNYKKNKLYMNCIITIFFLSQIFLIPLLFAIFNNSTLYDGWRHFFFMYPVLLIISIMSISSIIYSFKTRFFYLILISFITTGSIIQSYWNFKYHPFQHSYFNKLFYEKPNEKFESDYWGISNKYLIDQLLLYEKSDKIFYKFESSNFILSLDILNNEEKKRFIEYNNQVGIDYYYIFVLKRFRNFDKNIFYNLRNKNEVISEVIINNTVINGVYKIKIN